MIFSDFLKIVDTSGVRQTLPPHSLGADPLICTHLVNHASSPQILADANEQHWLFLVADIHQSRLARLRCHMLYLKPTASLEKAGDREEFGFHLDIR